MPSKYRAVRTNGFASKREAKVAADLQILERAGKIGPINYQVAYTLLPPCEGFPRPLRYTSDFTYCDSDGVVHVVDAKGFRTPVYKIKKRLMKQLLDIDIEEV